MLFYNSKATRRSAIASEANTSHGTLTPKLMLQLAAPHTWPASIFPVLVATAYATVVVARTAHGSFADIDHGMVVVLLAISVLFQSAVNTINDYFDYAKGTDTVDNQDDPTDAVLVYNDIDPKHALLYFGALMAAAFALGIYCIVRTGPFPLVIALVGAVVVVLYSGGKTPISYLPIGEVVSGLTMGYLITLASCFCLLESSQAFVAQQGHLDSAAPIAGLCANVFFVSLPVVASIALIMLTNNTCDIQKDLQARRKTLPVLLGHERSVRLYHGIVYFWVVLVCAISLMVAGAVCWVVLPFMLLAVHPLGRALLANPLTAESRGQAFGQCMSLNIALNTFYALALFAGA